jgi:hypothetical protein
MLGDEPAKADDLVLVDVLRSFRLTVIVHIRSARKHSPRYVGKLAADERIVLRRSRAEAMSASPLARSNTRSTIMSSMRNPG